MAETTGTSLETLLATGGGTYAPKHALLARAYAAVGRETRFVYVSFRFDDMPGDFPPDLRVLAHDGVLRAHAALLLRRGDAWLDVDATFDRPLARAAFMVNDLWDGRSSMPLVVRSMARVESTLGPEHEEDLFGLPAHGGFPRAVVGRLNAWLESVRHP